MIIPEEAEKSILEWGAIQESIKRGASDIHLCPKSPPIARVNGALVPLDYQTLGQGDVDRLIELMTDRMLRARFYNETRLTDLDFTIQFPRLKRRFRVNVFRQLDGSSITMRVLPEAIYTLQELGVPEKLAELSTAKSGLLLVTGGAGSGKSTTLASVIELINRNEPRHIITIEDPIENVFVNRKALIEQREVGAHVATFEEALRSALREAPDVILVGEIRDQETAKMALRASMVGSLVLATLHTRSAQETLNRYIALFEDKWRGGVRSQLADCLLGVLCQKLLPDKSQSGRVAACEMLIGTKAVKHVVRDDRTHLLHSIMEISSNDGMMTMEDSLLRLYETEKIELQVAYDHCNDKQAFLAHLPPKLQAELTLSWETEVELKQLEQQREAKGRKASYRMV